MSRSISTASRLRRLIPQRHGWLRVIGAPTSYVLVIGFCLTALAKVAVLRKLGGVHVVPAWSLVVSAPDLAFYMGLAALFAFGEGRRPWLLFITVPLSALAFALAVANAGYLGLTGEQLSWHTVALGIARFSEVRAIVGEQLAHMGATVWLAAAVLGVGLPTAALAALRRATGSARPFLGSDQRAHCAALLALAGLVGLLVAPRAASLPLRHLEANATLRTYLGWIGAGPESTEFAGYQPELVEPETIAALARGPRPNIVVVVLESTRRDVTSLAGAGALARTPNLLALARAGVEVETARAVVPHTTKSLWTMFCDRLPLMQTLLYETTTLVHAQCLPAVLRQAGWRTGFLQSAVGAFEDRPRLVAKMGFQTFEAWEEIGGQPLGILGSDDASLGAPFARFVDASRGHPFLAVLLTSGTHFPYRLPGPQPTPHCAPKECYARLVEDEDALLGEVLRVLDARGLRQHTIVVALGDHGEGFGDKGVRQHDSNFFEEGLRMPWVMAGPGVPRRVVHGNASVIDLTPTLLDVLGAGVRPDVGQGVSVLRGLPNTPRLFACWIDGRCQGYVQGTTKVVYVPDTQETFAFDLANDPDENRPRPLTAAQRLMLGDVNRTIQRYRTQRPMDKDRLDAYPLWSCPAHADCRHPKSPPYGMFPM